MNTVKQVLAALEKKGSAQTRKTYCRHGAPDDMFGVKVGDMKVIAKQIKDNHQLALDLYDTGNADAMYLASMVVDPQQLTKRQLDAWIKAASWYMLSDHAVAGVAAESPHARDRALKWMKSKRPLTASAGWATYSNLVSISPDEQLDLDEIQNLLDRVLDEIDAAANRVRHSMNNFVISVGCYVKPLLRRAKAVAKKLGAVEVDMGETNCQTPVATDYIAKVESMGRVGKKRKSARC